MLAFSRPFRKGLPVPERPCASIRRDCYSIDISIRIFVMKALRTFFLPALIASVLLVGCDASDMGNEEVDLTLRLEGLFDGQQLTGQVFEHNGANITLESARIYLSEISLTTADGEVITFESDAITVPAKDANDNDVSHTVTDKIILAKHDLGMEDYHLGMVPEGDYTSMSFRLGIVGMDNRIDASQVPSNHSLAKQTDKNNHWNWANGYIYLRVDGQVDTDGDGTVDEDWNAHIGKDDFSRVITLDTNFTLDHETGNEVHVMVDYHDMLHMVDLADPAERVTHTSNNLPMTNKIIGMVDSAFMLHGVHMSEHDHDHNH